MGSVSVDTDLDTTTRYFEASSDGSDVALSDHVVLASWLLTLVRTRDDRAATFEWALGEEGAGDRDAYQQMHRRRFSSRDLLGKLDLNSEAESTTLDQLTDAVDSYLASGVPGGRKKTVKKHRKQDTTRNEASKADEKQTVLRHCLKADGKKVDRAYASLVSEAGILFEKGDSKIAHLHLSFSPRDHVTEPCCQQNHDLP